MITIKIKHKKQKEKNRLFPTDLHGLPYGQFYIMLSENTGCQDKTPSYFMTTGYNDTPIIFWWNPDENTYEVAPAELSGYAPHIYVERIEANLVMELNICR